MQGTRYARLLEDSSLAASMEECLRTYPTLGRPIMVTSRQQRSNEPWFRRTCIYLRSGPR